MLVILRAVFYKTSHTLYRVHVDKLKYNKIVSSEPRYFFFFIEDGWPIFLSDLDCTSRHLMCHLHHLAETTSF